MYQILPIKNVNIAKDVARNIVEHVKRCNIMRQCCPQDMWHSCLESVLENSYENTLESRLIDLEKACSDGLSFEIVLDEFVMRKKYDDKEQSKTLPLELAYCALMFGSGAPMHLDSISKMSQYIVRNGTEPLNQIYRYANAHIHTPQMDPNKLLNELVQGSKNYIDLRLGEKAHSVLEKVLSPLHGAHESDRSMHAMSMYLNGRYGKTLRAKLHMKLDAKYLFACETAYVQVRNERQSSEHHDLHIKSFSGKISSAPIGYYFALEAQIVPPIFAKAIYENVPMSRTRKMG